MNPLLIVLPFHAGDAENAHRLLDWIVELEDDYVSPARPILLAADSAVPLETCKEIKTLAQVRFHFVDTITVRVNAKDWRAPNEMFRGIAQYIKEHYHFPFLWLEPDCIPLTPDWFDRLADAYARSPRLYMGAFVECSDPKLPAVHMAGCGIYPSAAIDWLDKYCNEKAEFAWDIGMAKDIVAGCRAQKTELIQSYYGEKDLGPSFVQTKVQGQTYAANVFDVSFLDKRAVLFHRNKDGTLIDVLRECQAVKSVSVLNDISGVNYNPNPEDMDDLKTITRSERMKEIWAKRKAQKAESLGKIETPVAT